MNNTEAINAKWKETIVAAIGNSYTSTIGTVTKDWLLDDKHVQVLPKEGGMVELVINYPDMGDDSDILQVTIPKKIAATLQELGADPSRTKLRTTAYKDYSWMCYGGSLNVLLPDSPETIELLGKVAKGVGTANLALFDLQEQFTAQLAKLAKDSKIPQPEIDEWLKKLPDRLAKGLQKTSQQSLG
jgi:hypothetical protein